MKEKETLSISEQPVLRTPQILLPYNKIGCINVLNIESMTLGGR